MIKDSKLYTTFSVPPENIFNHGVSGNVILIPLIPPKSLYAQIPAIKIVPKISPTFTRPAMPEPLIPPKNTDSKTTIIITAEASIKFT
ncbi:hypothetical protein SDC9_171874 [bioreactor metagenome]|uniref:Uncharacterized protein n=1 Tax=bioreactor metagenome TaxID=1076179 RepID=A0A645GCR5_9ZZZZ